MQVPHRVTPVSHIILKFWDRRAVYPSCTSGFDFLKKKPFYWILEWFNFVILRSPCSVLLMYLGLQLIFFTEFWGGSTSFQVLTTYSVRFWRLSDNVLCHALRHSIFWTDVWGKHHVGSSARTPLNFTHHWGGPVTYIRYPIYTAYSTQVHTTTTSRVFFWIFLIGSFDKSETYLSLHLITVLKHAS